MFGIVNVGFELVSMFTFDCPMDKTEAFNCGSVCPRDIFHTATNTEGSDTCQDVPTSVFEVRAYQRSATITYTGIFVLFTPSAHEGLVQVPTIFALAQTCIGVKLVFTLGVIYDR